MINETNFEKLLRAIGKISFSALLVLALVAPTYFVGLWYLYMIGLLALLLIKSIQILDAMLSKYPMSLRERIRNTSTTLILILYMVLGKYI